MQKFLGKSTYIGFLCSAVTLVGVLCCGAALLRRGALEESAAPYIVCMACLLASFVGGLIATGRKDGRLPRTVATAAALYVLLWIAALASGKPIVFLPDGIRSTAALLCGALAAALLAPGKRKQKGGGKRQWSRRRPRRHTVT